jgi:Flp pilus assembly pilin Flp
VVVDTIRSILHDESGQTTAEYSLILLVAGLVVGVFAAFVKSGAMSDMFEEIVSRLISRARG